MLMPLAEYKKKINKATTEEELQAITYDALKNDDECTVFSKKYDKIIDLCVKRRAVLGLI